MTRFEAYKRIDAVNYSTLKAILSESFNYAKKKSDAMDLGNLVDCKITTPEEFEAQFAVITNEPGDKPKQIIDHIFDAESTEILPLDQYYKEYLYTLMDMYKYYSGTYKDKRDPRRLEKLISDSSEYYQERQKLSGKIIVSQKDIELADRIATSIKNGRFTAPFHNLPFGIKVHNQVVITWTTTGLACKALLDRVLENTTDNPIPIGSYVLPGKSVIIIDYKTMQGKVSRFSKQMWKYRYDIQGSFYSYGTNQWIAHNKPDVSLADFFFIVESTTSPGAPMVYRLSDIDKEIGRWGATKTYEGWIPAGFPNRTDFDRLANDFDLDVLGWEQALNLYKWHYENDEWEYSMDAVQSNGIIETTQYL